MEAKKQGIGWWIGWMSVGITITVLFFGVLAHISNVRVEKQKEYWEECYKWGPKDAEGTPVCELGFMPSYFQKGPFFRPPAASPSGS